MDPDLRRLSRSAIRRHYVEATAARLAAAVATPTPFPERLVHFWANHFAVSADKQTVIGFVGNYENEAIRPHIMGKFSDLLIAAVQHPAMLLYLDQAQSFGPDSRCWPRACATAAIASHRVSTKIWRARSWSCTRWGCGRAIRRPM